MADQRDIIIIRRAADSPNVTVEERAFLLDIATTLDAGASVHFLDRWRVQRLIGRAVFG